MCQPRPLSSQNLMVEGSTCNPSLCTWHVAVSRCRSSLAVIQKHPSLPELHREAYKIRDGFPHRKRADQLGRQNLFGITSLLPYLEKQIIRSSHTQGEQIRYKGMNNEYQEAGITGGYLRGCLTVPWSADRSNTVARLQGCRPKEAAAEQGVSSLCFTVSLTLLQLWAPCPSPLFLLPLGRTFLSHLVFDSCSASKYKTYQPAARGPTTFTF